MLLQQQLSVSLCKYEMNSRRLLSFATYILMKVFQFKPEFSQKGAGFRPPQSLVCTLVTFSTWQEIVQCFLTNPVNVGNTTFSPHSYT